MPSITRRQALKRIGATGAGIVLSRGLIRGQSEDIMIAGKPVEIAVSTLSPATMKITVLPLAAEKTIALPIDGAIGPEGEGRPISRRRARERFEPIPAGNLVVKFAANPPAPPTLTIETKDGRLVQRLRLSPIAPEMSFLMGKGPLLGLGQGGPQFDRKGSIDRMRSGQAGYQLATHGGRVPIQWLVGTDGWAMFIHQPLGTFDFTGEEGKFTAEGEGLPLDVYVIASPDPAVIMREYARITGLAEMPAMWTLGYMQSHRTLAGPEEVLGVARTMREKRLPCDALIYLGTDFTPSGWNSHNGEFQWKSENFPDPKGMIKELHSRHYKVMLHIVIEGKRLSGTVGEPCDPKKAGPSGRDADGRWPDDRSVPCYWPYHRPLVEAGVDGWWPDQGDGYDAPSRLARIRMYWEGTQMWRPEERPFALHRNGCAGMQRFGAFLWSGDVRSRWETLKTHVAVGINAGLSGIPYWGTDIGGFIPTDEYTGELHVRWFQFGAFCTSFRAHGRHWHLRLPWGWDGGDGGPQETEKWRAAEGELKNARVEPILRKYMELRARLMPYTYTAVRECCVSGMPVMRALWLHYPGNEAARGRGDEYLWGKDLLVAPVVEKGAEGRRVYLPRGRWWDWWREEMAGGGESKAQGQEIGRAGGREIEREVDLETLPIYVRAGAIVPVGPIRQYVDEPVEGPLTLVIYPGADGTGALYEDDGHTFAYRKGDWMQIDMSWEDAARMLTLSLAPGSRMRPQMGAKIDAKDGWPIKRTFEVRIAGQKTTRAIVFDGRALKVKL